MGIDLTEFNLAAKELRRKGWEITASYDSEQTDMPIIPYLFAKLSEDVSLGVYLHDTYYVQACFKKVPTDVPKMLLLNQVTYAPNGDIETPKENISKLKKRMSEKDGKLFTKFIKDFYFFLKPNSINFIME